jgi:hypothetical protein
LQVSMVYQEIFISAQRLLGNDSEKFQIEHHLSFWSSVSCQQDECEDHWAWSLAWNK